MSVIEIQDIYKTYTNATSPALNGVSLEIKQETIFGLLGPNGAGKSTTIAILSGLIKADKGIVKIFDKELNKNIENIKKQIGIVPQEYALFPTLTCYENLHYFGNLYGLKGKALKDKINNYLELFGLEKNANKLISSFSGGMKRRVNIIAGILHDPKLIILDEPTVGVDVQSRKMIIDFLKEYQKEHKISILYTSHHLEEAQEICDEIAIIDYGKIIVKGSPTELIKNHQVDSLENLFINLTGHSVRE
jgi:ABC-2 type transport system ATP-binding protein